MVRRKGFYIITFNINDNITNLFNICFVVVLIVAFDLCDINTLGAAKTWYEEAAASAINPVTFLVGMKKDMLVGTSEYT